MMALVLVLPLATVLIFSAIVGVMRLIKRRKKEGKND